MPQTGATLMIAVPVRDRLGGETSFHSPGYRYVSTAAIALSTHRWTPLLAMASRFCIGRTSYRTIAPPLDQLGDCQVIKITPYRWTDDDFFGATRPGK
jgi:hypothetical protein